MKTLAIDFSTAQRAVALLEGPPWGSGSAGGPSVQVLAQRQAAAGEGTGIALIDATLAAGGIEREAIEGVVVGLGPGSYTGVRIAIALAQGWELARNTVTAGISSVDCLAALYAERNQGEFWVVLDAQRNEFYLAGGTTTAAAGWHWTDPLHLATGDEARHKTARGGVVIGPEATRWFKEGKVIHPDAGMLGRLAWRQPQTVPAHQLEPIYLRAVTFVKAPAAIRIPGE